MEIKKYIRFRSGEIAEVLSISKNIEGFTYPVLYFKYLATQHGSSNSMYKEFMETIVDSKDTPQELVQDNDIGFIKEWQSIETLYTSEKGKYCYMDSHRWYIGKDITITKILTPHGKDYICQWESE